VSRFAAMAAENRHGKETVWVCVGVAVVLYFAFPFCYAIPMMLLCKVVHVSSDVPLRVFFKPVDWLGKHSPAYRRLLEWEGSALRKSALVELFRE